MQAFLRAYLVEEGIRLHTACLTAVRDDDASRIADRVLAVDGSPTIRRAIVASAVIANQPRAMHATILGDADPDLSARLKAALEAPSR